MTSLNLEQLIINFVTQLFPPKKIGFLIASICNWQHTIIGKTYLNTTFVDKKMFGLCKIFVITSL